MIVNPLADTHTHIHATLLRPFLTCAVLSCAEQVGGFEAVSKLLRSHEFTTETPTSLLQLALGSFRVGEGGHEGAGSETLLVHAQAVQVRIRWDTAKGL